MSSRPTDTSLRYGLFYGLAAYGLWGLVPAFFKSLSHVSAFEVLAHRIVWSVLFLGLIVTLRKRWPDVRACWRQRRLLTALIFSAFLIALNWMVYIYGVMTDRIVHTSLGYYITPLVNILLGLIAFRETMRPLQWGALGLAGGAVVVLVVAAGELPWIALCLAASFGLYGLIRKKAVVDSLVGLMVETLVLLPVGLGALLYWESQGTLSFGHQGTATNLLLASTGVVTAIPLLCFGFAAQRLPMSVLGILQYLAPTLQYIQAVLFFGEPFTGGRAASLGFVLAALVLYTVDSLVAARRRSTPVAPPD